MVIREHCLGVLDCSCIDPRIVLKMPELVRERDVDELLDALIT
jgi:hypothetical protein